jgi:DNA-binding NarL/FixJ family response regulator
MASKVLRLLIVDDDEAWRFVLNEIFAPRPDVAVAQAASGPEAVERVRREDYDLVLLDMRMPSGTEGLDALPEIKRLKPQTEVLMMSAYGDVRKTAEAMKRGARGFVPKEADFKEAITLEVNEYVRTFHLMADRELLIKTKYAEVLRGTDSREKGKALEDLLAALFSSVGGFIEIGRNVTTQTEEIDLVFRNDSVDARWQKESQIILIECKNWHSQRVGKNEFVAFKDKMENRYGRCKLGFLVCVERFALTLTQEMLRSSKSELLVVPTNGAQLRQLVAARDRSQLLRSFLDEALLT